jgi:hypothetical protein
MPLDTAALQEAFRRRTGQLPSTAGIPGGAEAANTITPTNPLSPQFNKQPSGSLPKTASATGMAQLRQSQPGEAEIIVKALIQRLRSLTPSPQGGGNVQQT